MIVNVQDIRAVKGDCSICGEPDQLLVAAAKSCLHKPLMCRKCMSEYLDSAFASSGLQDMRCPFAVTEKCKVVVPLIHFLCCVDVCGRPSLKKKRSAEESDFSEQIGKSGCFQRYKPAWTWSIARQ